MKRSLVNMPKIKVLEVINEATVGGGQKHVILLAKNLNTERFHVLAASSTNGPFIEELTKIGIRHIPVKMKGILNFQAIFSICSLVRKERIDIVHTHGGIAGLSGRLGAFLSRSPVIVHTLHGIHYLNYKNRFLKWLCIQLEKIFSIFTDAIIFVSDSDKEKAKENKLVKNKKINVIKNGIEFSEVQSHVDVLAKKKTLGIDSSWPLIGTVARLHPQKGHIYLLKAAKKIIEIQPQTRFLIIGSGQLRTALEDYCKQFGISDNVIFLGTRNDVPELLQIIDIFVLPSLWEGFPIALMEAMASGKPVVATRVDGNREIVEHKRTGILVEPKNPDSLSNAILTLLKDKDYCCQLSKNGKREVMDKYSVLKMVKETEKLYIDLYERKFSVG
ncbi:MAG: glycosyltransferase family 4 protein [Candidatus Aminicenantes bacterium]|nr:glycosyltransferase family 4 protein [Candidatus Aminicenantes bacterium]